MSEAVFCFNPVRPEFIYRAIETLYKFTPIDFRVFVCDQTIEGLDRDFIKKYVHWYMKPYQNLGFAKSANEMMWTAYRQGYPYIAVCNDDIEYINNRWWQGILDEFATNDKILVVSPESIRVPLWGYGRDHDEVLDLLPYKESYTEEEYEWLLKGEYESILERYPKEPQDLPLREDGRREWSGKIYVPPSFPLKKRGVVDANAAWHPVFKREALEIIGYFDERFLYGGGEDYDYNARVYRQKYRFVGSMKSWVWHWWGKSKDEVSKLPPELFNRPFWNDNDYLWPPELNGENHVDPWGYWTDKDGIRHPFKRIPDVAIDPL